MQDDELEAGKAWAKRQVEAMGARAEWGAHDFDRELRKLNISARGESQSHIVSDRHLRKVPGDEGLASALKGQLHAVVAALAAEGPASDTGSDRQAR
jgi:hypothetical protein